jgi:type I restriction enzyme M protein
MDNRSIRKLEAELWESADLLRAGSKLTSNQYCMPVLGLIFLRYAYSRFITPAIKYPQFNLYAFIAG